MFKSRYPIVCNLTNNLKTIFSNFTPKMVKKPHFLPFFCHFLPFYWTKLYIWHPKTQIYLLQVPGHYKKTFGGERLGPNLFSTKKTPKNGVFERFFAFFCQISSQTPKKLLKMLSLRFWAIYRISTFIFEHFFSLFFEPPSRTLKFCLFKAPGAPLWPPIAPHRVRCVVLCSNHVT